jgi:hypothetical protein
MNRNFVPLLRNVTSFLRFAHFVRFAHLRFAPVFCFAETFATQKAVPTPATLFVPKSQPFRHDSPACGNCHCSYRTETHVSEPLRASETFKVLLRYAHAKLSCSRRFATNIRYAQLSSRPVPTPFFLFGSLLTALRLFRASAQFATLTRALNSIVTSFLTSFRSIPLSISLRSIRRCAPSELRSEIHTHFGPGLHTHGLSPLHVVLKPHFVRFSSGLRPSIASLRS